MAHGGNIGVNSCHSVCRRGASSPDIRSGRLVVDPNGSDPPMPLSPAAYRIASHWASSRKHPPAPAHRQDIAEQAQSHLSHGADPDYLRRIAWWMATEQPTWFDLSLAMQMSGAPQPAPTTAPGGHRRCPCRGALTAAA